MFMEKVLLAIAIFAIGTPLFSQSYPSEETAFDIIFQHDFSNNTPGDYKKEEWYRDWNKPNWASQSLGYGRILQQGDNKYLQETFPPETFMLKGSGVQWQAKFSQGYEELYLSYRVKFSSGFANTNLRGKLPGLSGGKSNNGGYMPNGRDGFSSRFIFHGTNIRFYIYHPDQYKAFGDSYPVPGKKYYGTGAELQPGYTLKPEVWYTVTQRIVLNTPGKHNGLVEGFINGKICARITGLRFRDTATLMIDRLFFANFLGGDGKPTAKEEFISFDDFFVFAYKPWVDIARNRDVNRSGTVLLLPSRN